MKEDETQWQLIALERRFFGRFVWHKKKPVGIYFLCATIVYLKGGATLHDTRVHPIVHEIPKAITVQQLTT